MNKWEYKIESTNEDVSLSQLNKYGEEGWELILIHPFIDRESDKRNVELIFKRKLYN